MGGILLHNVGKHFQGDKVLDDVSLEVPEGRTLVLFGPSGAGKTVLLRCIAGAVIPDEGRVVLGGEDMTDVDPEYRGVGMAFQNFALFPHMTAFENIASPLRARKHSVDAIKTQVNAIATLLKIEHVLSHHPKALSNGQRQRTALARALVGSPGIVLLDDPLRNVDAKLRFEMRLELPKLLEEQEHSTTVVYVTQDYKEAMALGDEIAVLAQGKIVQIGTPEDIYLRPANIEIARLFGEPAINLLDVMPQRDDAGCHVTISQQRIALAPQFSHTIGQPCVLGVRPEAVRFSEDALAVPVSIDAETPFNEKTISLTRTHGQREILVSRPAGSPAPSLGAARIALDMHGASLFERDGGRRIHPEPLLSGRVGASG